ncbi:metal-sensing transcriptional repressor [Leptolyngbya sp. FACHB-261]|uniref:metal-sensing transcriptional repressor n=1 Tax=Leptolyngbya sp. FACHB-261 TaxID=2692806 RepID=UPI001689E1CC|nr:metal-sensing transcriptional repressor [Leptolyngbya sp. FACHB-261]MBD2104515.1 metal-sensing transcriptional repressor [Leptolyngbya sp. FACHB-261]
MSSLHPPLTHPDSEPELLDSPVEPEPHSHSHPHVHDSESVRRLSNRLSRIEGHIRGIKRMVQESSPCPDVLIQVAAVRGALDRVAHSILEEHLTQCIARAAQEGNIETEIAELKVALDRFLK